MEHLIQNIAVWITHFISYLGYPGIILLMTIESACIPLPSEITMPFSGYLATQGQFNFWIVALCGTFGNWLGSAIVYYAGTFGGHQFLARIAPHHVKKSEDFYKKYGMHSVFLGRLLPVIRTFISVPAGLMKVPFSKFSFWTILGSFPWCVALTYAGVLLGKNWGILLPIFHRINLPIILLTAAGIVVWLWKYRD